MKNLNHSAVLAAIVCDAMDESRYGFSGYLGAAAGLYECLAEPIDWKGYDDPDFEMPTEEEMKTMIEVCVNIATDEYIDEDCTRDAYDMFYPEIENDPYESAKNIAKYVGEVFVDERELILALKNAEPGVASSAIAQSITEGCGMEFLRSPEIEEGTNHLIDDIYQERKETLGF